MPALAFRKLLYVQATADEVTDEQELVHALAALERRGWKKPLNEVTGASIQRVYKAVPERMWTNTDGSLNGQHFDTRVELDLLGK